MGGWTAGWAGYRLPRLLSHPGTWTFGFFYLKIALRIKVNSASYTKEHLTHNKIQYLMLNRQRLEVWHYAFSVRHNTFCLCLRAISFYWGWFYDTATACPFHLLLDTYLGLGCCFFLSGLGKIVENVALCLIFKGMLTCRTIFKPMCHGWSITLSKGLTSNTCSKEVMQSCIRVMCHTV